MQLLAGRGVEGVRSLPICRIAQYCQIMAHDQAWLGFAA